MNATEIRPHQIRVSPSDLEALARIWLWEREIQEQLASVLETGRVLSLVQGMFDLRSESPLLVGYQALSRFPSAPRIPSGLWFAVAEQIGEGDPLIEVTARKAIDLLPRIPEDSKLFVHASPLTAMSLMEVAAGAHAGRLVLQIPSRPSGQPLASDAAAMLREHGVGLAVDNAKGIGAWADMLEAAGVGPRYVTVDISGGIGEDQARASYSRLGAWCHEREVILVAKRVERATDLRVLRDLGFAWGQGYALSPPTEI